MGLRWLPRFGHPAADDDTPSASELAAFDALDEALIAFARGPESFDEAGVWAKVEAGIHQPRRASWLLPAFPGLALSRVGASTQRVAAGAVVVATLTAGAIVWSVLLSGDDVARAEFFEAVDTLDDVSNEAYADGQISAEEATALSVQVTIVEQSFDNDPAVVANSSADATSQAIDVLTGVRTRLIERSVVAEDAGGPTANAVVVLERVTEKLEAASRGRGQRQGNQEQGAGAADERGRGQGNQGQGIGNAPTTQGIDAESEDDDSDGASTGRGTGGRP